MLLILAVLALILVWQFTQAILLIAIPIILMVGGAISQAAMLFSSLILEGREFSLRSIDTWMAGAVQACLRKTSSIIFTLPRVSVRS